MTSSSTSAWATVTVGELCQLTNGRAFKPADWSTVGLPIVRIQNLNNKGASFNFFEGEVLPKRIIEPRDLLFAWSGTPGTSFGAHTWHGARAVLNQHIFKVEHGRHVDRDFLRFAINLKLEELISKAHGGAGLQHVTKGKFEETELPLPPLAEQKQIVAKLDALNEKSARARAELARIETLVTRYKQAVLAKAFSPDACENPAANWRFAKLQELLESGPTNGWSPKADGEIGALKSLKLSATSSGRLVLNPNTIKYIDQTLPEASKYWLLPDDILIQRANCLELLGTTVLYNGPENDFIYPDLMMRIRADRRLVRPEYLAKYLNARHTREYFRSHATGTAGNMPKINGSVVRQTPVHYPSLEHQDTIIRQVGDQFSKIDRIAAEAKRALELVGKLDEAILAKAFRGELVAQDPNDEPASVLLDRIRAEREAAPKQRSWARAKKSAATE